MERVPRDLVDLPADRDEDHLAPEAVRDRGRRAGACSRARAARVAGGAASDGEGIPTMRPCARSSSTRRDSPGSRTRPRRADPMRVLACGLCGSDVEKIGARAGGHGARARGRRRRAGRRRASRSSTTCPAASASAAGPGTSRPASAFAEPTIVPGGFAERVAAADGVELPDGSTTRTARTSSRSPACSAAPSACRAAACSSSATASSGGSSRRCCARRGDEVFAVDARPGARRAARPTGRSTRPCSARRRRRLDAVEPGGTVLVFADAGPVDLDAGLPQRADAVRLALGDAAAHGTRRAALLPELDLPEPTVLPLERFAEGLELYRSGRALKVVFTP